MVRFLLATRKAGGLVPWLQASGAWQGEEFIGSVSGGTHG
jgi:hypothetical protein